MRRVGRGIVGFVVGDDIGIAGGVLLLLGATAVLVHIGGAAWWLLPVGVPAALWLSLQRARRAARRAWSRS